MVRRLVHHSRLVIGLTVACVSGLHGQRNSYAPYDPVSGKVPYDGHFTFVRLSYTVAAGGYYYRGLPAWAHGFATAEENLLKISADISLFRPHLNGTDVLAIDDPELFKYPISYMTEAGYWLITDSEVTALRRYLNRGGFLILDDTRDGFSQGNLGWANIAANFQRVFPGYHMVDLTPAHPIFHSFFDISSFDIITQYYDRGRPVIRALFQDDDPNKRIMVLINFNTDVSNFWEYSATGFKPVAESNQAYKLGFDYLIYALTH
jgi:hypothetical protein